MPGFVESKITLEFPDTNFFRLADCYGYTTLSGSFFKEMDACWYDSQEDIFWLIELKDYSLGTIESKESIDNKSWALVKKAVDSLCMVLSVLHKYPSSKNLTPCFPIIPTDKTSLKFVSIVHCKDIQKPDVQNLNNQFRAKFKPYASLFGISHYAVMEHSSAIKYLPKNFVK